jgi:hypothetical protein
MVTSTRAYHRLPVELQVRLHVRSGRQTVTTTGRCHNLSEGGMFVQIATHLGAGCHVRVEILSDALGEAFAAAGEVVHVIKGEGVGIRFTDLDLRALDHLKRLLGMGSDLASGGQANTP